MQQNDWGINRKHKDPRREKLKEFRKGMQTIHFHKENKAARKQDYRRYRNQMKSLLRNEKYEFLRKYQRTSGWITW
ncbi:hypothetical protein [Cohnella sp. GCM10012308]|uniref:hypothetical protein n=1 Tax=Cohnella sp. GCM10012308 TaxID=3317329 RepID=UPI00360DD9A9